MSWLFRNFRYKALALGLAVLLWGVSHGTSSVERGFDIPVALQGVPQELVVTGQSTDAVNIRVKGTRAALRSLTAGDLEYPVDLSGAKPGRADRHVERADFDEMLPRGSEMVSRSPSNIDFTLERRATKAVRVRPDLEGDPAEGFVLGEVEVEPSTVRITGARSEVLRLSEVLTETIDVTGVEVSVERTVKPSIRGRHVWLEESQEVTVRVVVESLEKEPG